MVGVRWGRMTGEGELRFLRSLRSVEMTVGGVRGFLYPGFYPGLLLFDRFVVGGFKMDPGLRRGDEWGKVSLKAEGGMIIQPLCDCLG